MRREGSEYGELISQINQAGKIVPSHITVGLLENEIKKLSSNDNSIFLIDGFPRYYTYKYTVALTYCIEIKKTLTLGPSRSMNKNINSNFVFFLIVQFKSAKTEF